LPDPVTWTVLAQDYNSTEREYTESVTNLLTGQITLQSHIVTEVATGLNFQDASSGGWQASQDLIEPTADGGAAALHGPNLVYFDPDPTADSAVKILTWSNRVFQTRVLGVYYFDSATGTGVLLAAPTNTAVAQLLPPNQLLYKGAFNSAIFKADLRFTYTKAGLESDVIITSQPKLSPADCGLDPATTQLQVRHQWLNAPMPRINQVIIGQGTGTEIADQILDFGDLSFPSGRAFAWDGGSATDTNAPAQIALPSALGNGTDVPVGKQWVPGPDKSTLIESAAWSSLAPKLAQLPLIAASGSGSKTRLAAAKAPAGEAPGKSSPVNRRIVVAQKAHDKLPGVVLDYIAVAPTGTNLTFNAWTPNGGVTNSDGSYVVSSSAYFIGTLTFQPNCVIKIKSNGYLLTSGGLVCNGTCSSPSVITSYGDPMYGADTNFDCVNYEPDVALYIWNINTNVTISGMNIRHANTGVYLNAYLCGSVTQTFSNSRVYMCGTGIYLNGAIASIQNSAYCQVTTPIGMGTGCSAAGSFTNNCPNTLPYLQCAVINGTLALANGLTPSASTTNMLNVDANNFPTNYNTSCWLYGKTGYSSVSVSNSLGDWTDCRCTLVAPRHAIGVSPDHGQGNFTGLYYRFIGTDNIHYVVQCKGHIGVTNNGVETPYGVLLFNTNLPSTVARAQLLPDYPSVTNKVPFLNWPNANYAAGPCQHYRVPCVSCNRGWRLPTFSTDWYSAFWSWLGPSPDSAGMAASLWLPNWTYATSKGDSGNPVFVLIQNQLILQGVWYTGDWAPATGFCRPTLVNAAIQTVDAQNHVSTGDAVSVIDLSGFTDCLPCNGPDVVGCPF